jgi:hypothetical protein
VSRWGLTEEPPDVSTTLNMKVSGENDSKKGQSRKRVDRMTARGWCLVGWCWIC